MKPKPDSLDRLMRAAARAPQAAAEPISPRLMACVLSARPASAPGGDLFLLVAWLRRGFALACALAAIVLALNLPNMLGQPEDDLDSWNSIANLTWMP